MSHSALASSFAAVAGGCPTVLVLGSVPGQASLKAFQYYAHPRNAFWPIVVSTIDNTRPNHADAHAIPYEIRIQKATDYGLALWDVLASCHRPGSLDSNIERSSEVANPIGEWLRSHPSVVRVCFNGKTAETSFKRHLQAEVNATLSKRRIEFVSLPSTSPAMATLNLTEKFEQWRPALTRS